MKLRATNYGDLVEILENGGPLLKGVIGFKETFNGHLIFIDIRKQRIHEYHGDVEVRIVSEATLICKFTQTQTVEHTIQ